MRYTAGELRAKMGTTIKKSYTIKNPNGNEPSARAMGDKYSIIDRDSQNRCLDNDEGNESTFTYDEGMEPNQYDKTGSTGFWNQHH